MKRTIFLVILGSLIAVSVFSQADLQPAAIVNLIRSEPITVKQVRTEIERFEKGLGRTLSENERREVLDTMINERLVIQAAERDRISITENEVNQQIQQLRGAMAQQIGRQPTDAEFNQALREQGGMDLQTYREQLRRQMILSKYLQDKKGSLITSIKPPTEDEILYEFNLRRKDLVRLETVEFDAIQIPYGTDAASRTRARELADRLVRTIGSDPTKFDAEGDRAQMPNSGYKFDKGSVPRHEIAEASFGKDFVNTAFSLRQGQVSKLIESTSSYLIIKVTRNLELKLLEFEDTVPYYLLPPGVDPRTRTTVKNLLGTLMYTERQQAVLKQATEELVSELRTGRTFQIFERNLNW